MIQMEVKRIRLDLDKNWTCIPSAEATMCGPYTFAMEANGASR